MKRVTSMKVKIFTLLCTALMYCFSAGVLHARYIHVAAWGSAAGSPYATLEQGIQAANASAGVDDIRVHSGNYTLPVSGVQITEECKITAHSGATVSIDIPGPFGHLTVCNVDAQFNGIEFRCSAGGYGQTAVVGTGSDARIHFMECRFSNFPRTPVQGRGCNRVELKFCSFSDNSGVNGGAMRAVGVEEVFVEDCQFSKNSTVGDGGAICLVDCTIATIYRSWLIDNVALNRGGAVFVDNVVDLEMRNDVVSGNLSLQEGGGIRFQNTGTSLLLAGSLPIIRMNVVNCTIFDNLAMSSGGGLSVQPTVVIPRCYTRVVNSILWNNKANARLKVVAQCDVPPDHVDHCCIEGWGVVASYTGTDVIALDPQVNAKGELMFYSPCINQGNRLLFPSAGYAMDIAQKYRVVGTEIDLGAHEYQADLFGSEVDKLDVEGLPMSLD